jgi:hypothetical protein
VATRQRPYFFCWSTRHGRHLLLYLLGKEHGIKAKLV